MSSDDRHRTSIMTGRRTAWLFALLPLLLAVLAIGLLGEGERTQQPTDSLPAGMDSTRATELAERIETRAESVAIVVFDAEQGTLDEQQTAGLAAVAESIGAPPQSLTIAEDGTAAFVVVPVDSASATDTIDEVDALRDTLREETPDGVEAQVTGPAGIEADLAQVFDGANTRLLMVTAGVVALLLVITYRSPVLWLVPLIVVGIADRTAAVLATQVLGRLDVAWNESTVGILSVLVFGAGTDYALLLISRYRDELRQTSSRHVAMTRAVRGTLEPVLASSTTVVLGLLTLLLSLTPTTRGLGLACAIGVVVAAAFVLVVLPALLVLFGRWVFWPRVPHEGAPGPLEQTTLWGRIGQLVDRRPRTLAGATVLLLGVLAAGVLQLQTGLDPEDQFLEKPEAIAAAERLTESFPAGTSSPVQVLTRAEPAEVTDAVGAVDGVVSSRVSAEGEGISQVDVVLSAEPGSAESERAIETLRDRLADLDETHVGGDEAAAIDERAGADRDRRLILPLILLVVLVALVLLLRSLLAPVLLVATVVGTYAASLGASWWLFTGVLGFDALDNQVPLFAFLFLVALGVDYNIFLVSRARQEAREHGTRRGMLRALTVTGGVITSAGILLGAVFAALGVLPLVVLAQLGVVICLGVLLDTLLVRTVLVPALAVMLGERFWWPGRVSRRSAA